MIIAIIVGVALASPASCIPLGGDESGLIDVATTTRHCEGIGGLWNFYGKTPEERACLIDQGVMAWWLNPHVRFALARPLASVVFRAEYALWGDAAVGYQLVTLAWFVGFLIAASLLFRHVLSERAAIIAMFVLAMQGARWESLGAPCGIHGWIAVVFSILAVDFHVRGREQQRRALIVPSLACYAIALLGGETGIETICFVLAYELAGTRSTWRTRARSLLPLTLLTVLYLTAYKALGFGMVGHPDYADPITDPVRYLGHVIQGVPKLVMAMLSEVHGLRARCDTTDSFLAELRWSVAGPLLALAVAVHGALWLRVRHSFDDRTRRTVRWLAVAAVIAMLPAVSGDLGTRLLLMPGLAGAGVIAVVLDHGARLLRQSRVTAVLCGVVAVVHFVIAPTVLVINLVNMRDVCEREHQATEPDLAKLVDVQPTYSGDVIVLTTPSYWSTSQLRRYFPSVHDWFVVLKTRSIVELRRTGDRTFELADTTAPPSPPPEGYYAIGSELSLPLGLRVKLADIGSVPVGGSLRRAVLRRLSFEATRSLDDPSWEFVAWNGRAAVRVAVPPPGQSVVLGPDAMPAR